MMLGEQIHQKKNKYYMSTHMYVGLEKETKQKTKLRYREQIGSCQEVGAGGGKQ